MDPAAELERNPVVSKHQIRLSMERSKLTREGTAELVSRDQILRHECGRGNIHFPCSADHDQDWQACRLIHTLAIICVSIHVRKQE